MARKAEHERLPNLVYVRAAAESLPAELRASADRVTVVLPWGSLLAALTRPSQVVLAGVRALCRPSAEVTLVLGWDAGRDGAEAARLGLPPLDAAYLQGPLARAYAEAGLQMAGVVPVDAEALRRWPSTWARRLAFGLRRPLYRIEALASVVGLDCGSAEGGRT
jgi:hypothetical protein